MSLKGTEIFKYCSYDVGELIVSGQILKFSNPSAFNDPFDCDINLLEFDFSECSQEVKTEMENIKQNLSKKWGIDLHKAIDSIPKDKIEEIYKKSQMVKINKSSICCFSTNCQSKTMWSHYADNHKGLCLIFDQTNDNPFLDYSLERFTHGHVNYDNSTTINYLKSKREGIIKLFLTKSTDWKYEGEFRYIVFEDYGFFRFREEFLKGVIFGLKVDENDIYRFIKICKKKGLNDLIFGRFTKNKLDMDFEIYNEYETQFGVVS